MKKYLLFGILAIVGPRPCYAGAFIEGQAGIANEVYGFSGGISGTAWEGTFEYQKKADHEDSLHMVGFGVTRNLINFLGFKLGLNIGGGLAIPDLESDPRGVANTADTGDYWTLGGNAAYKMSEHWSVSLGLKKLFCRVDTHQTLWTSHDEVLSTGQTVSVEDTTYFTGKRDFGAIFLSLGLRYSF